MIFYKTTWQSLLVAWLHSLWLKESAHLTQTQRETNLPAYKQEVKKISNQVSETAKQKLDQNSELWKETSEFVKLDDQEIRVLKFNPERIKIVEGQYGPRIQYTVIDPNYPDKQKKFEQGKLTSKEIDKYLRQGHTVLKVHRIGTGKDSKYNVQTTD